MKFSILIPSYNGSAYIEKAILSALDQKKAADEIIVSDDNSSDSTLSICEKYQDKIIIYRNPSGPSGFVNGWNNAIGKASGDYISILHQDDLLHPDFLFEAEKVLSVNPDIRHFFTICNYINEQGNISGCSHPDTGEIKRYAGIDYVKAYQQQGTPHIHRCPGVITHRSIFEKCRYEVLAGHIADDDFFYRVGMYTDVIGFIKPLASYRIHGQSETGKLDDVLLVRRLVDDYLYQSYQWKDNPFLDDMAYSFFIDKARSFLKRYIGYGIKHTDFRILSNAIIILLKNTGIFILPR